MLSCLVARASNLVWLSEDVYARSTRRSRKATLAWLEKLAAAAAVFLLPTTVECINLLAGALKAGTYRSGASYFGSLSEDAQAGGVLLDVRLGSGSV